MEGGGSVPSSSTTPIPIKSMMTSSSPSMGITPPPAPPPAGGCSETTNPVEGKRLKTDTEAEAEDGNDNDEVSGGGSGMPLVRERLHPLQNDVILTNLFERCPLDLLAKCRLVSKQWLDISLTTWRATSPVTLFDFPYGAKGPTFQKYLEFMDDPQNNYEGKPHRKMILTDWAKCLTKGEELQPFWERVGGNLTTLEFRDCHFPGAEELRRIIFGSCPNLSRLYLHSCSCGESAQEEEEPLEYAEPAFGEQTNLRSFSVQIPGCNRLPFPWLELLSHFAALASLKVSLNHRYVAFSETVTGEILQAIGTIKQRDGNKLRLQSLELDPPLTYLVNVGPHAHLEEFEELKLPLQFLEIEVESSDQPRDPLLEELLTRHSTTLSRITVRSEESEEEQGISRLPFSWGFPCKVALGKLEELQIHMLCTSLEFLKNMPKLKKLEFLEAPGFEHRKGEETKFFREPVATLLLEVRLVHLTEFRMDYRVTSEDITIFARMMPNVTKLTISLNDQLFSTVCGLSWGNLKELEVLGGDLTDEGVTGLDWERNKIAPAGITNLQGLESFKFWSRNLTDRSVFQGFLKLPACFNRVEAFGWGVSIGAGAKKSLQDKNIDVLVPVDDYDCNEFVDEDDRDF